MQAFPSALPAGLSERQGRRQRDLCSQPSLTAQAQTAGHGHLPLAAPNTRLQVEVWSQLASPGPEGHLLARHQACSGPQAAGDSSLCASEKATCPRLSPNTER